MPATDFFPKAIIFDHDGTLVDSERSHWKSWNETVHALSDGKVTISEEQYKQHCAGRTTLDTARYIQQHLLPDLDDDALYQIQRKARDADPGGAHPLLACADSAVRSLQKRFPLAIATGAERYSIDKTLKAYQWQSYFSAIATTSDVANPKPAPDVYRKAAHDLGLPPHQCLAIEDSQAGFRSATAAGCVTVLVASEFSPQEWAPANTIILASLCELETFIDQGDFT